MKNRYFPKIENIVIGALALALTGCTTPNQEAIFNDSFRDRDPLRVPNKTATVEEVCRIKVDENGLYDVQGVSKKSYPITAPEGTEGVLLTLIDRKTRENYVFVTKTHAQAIRIQKELKEATELRMKYPTKPQRLNNPDYDYFGIRFRNPGVPSSELIFKRALTPGKDVELLAKKGNRYHLIR